MTTEIIASPTLSVADDRLPLVVDLDGTLIKSDLLFESYFVSISNGPAHHARIARELLNGKASLKRFLAVSGRLNYEKLPYDDAVLDLIRSARLQGRPVYLATANDAAHAASVAAHLGLFDGWFASGDGVNLSGAAKAGRLVAAFGRNGFDYVGNGKDDLAVWACARRAYTIRLSSRVSARLGRTGMPVETLPHAPVRPRLWLKAIRVHQYAKNTLVFVPLLTAHETSMTAFLAAILAFVTFSACASGVYVINDLIDLEADRLHPSKHRRPFASGAIPIAQAALAVPVLLGLAVLCALSVSLAFAGVLAGYFALTTAYSLRLKRKMLVDAVTLAMLYTLRVIGGAAAIGVFASEWLLAFSMFIFLALALVKRHVELKVRLDQGLPSPANRNYQLGDISVVAALAAASGFNAVTIFSLYIASPSVEAMYRRPFLLWLICPILMYWIGRMLMLAHRGLIDDDPLVFAMRDGVSRLSVCLMLAIVLVSI